MKIDYKELAKECLSKYPCGIEVVVNPYYYHMKDRGSVLVVGHFEPHEVERLTTDLEEVSNQIYKEDGYYISGLDWLDIIPDDLSLLEVETGSEKWIDSLFD